MVRRIGALLVLAVVAIGVLKIADFVTGTDGTGAQAVDPSAGPTTVAPTAPSESALPSSVPVTAAPVATTSAASAVPSAADPAVVLIAGDSDAGTFGPYLESLLSDTGIVRTELDYKVSSGLARPDFFNWPEHFQTIIPQVAPDIVIATFGGNDSQGLAEVAGNFIAQAPTGEDDAEWRAEYGRRVGEVMDFLTADGRTLIWVGIPNDNNDDVTTRLRVQDEVVRAEVAKRPQVKFIDTWARFSGREGGWAEYVIDPRDKQGKDVRADDGFHLNIVGAEILALDIAEVVKQALRDRGATL
jgi:uncharacterized protein